jgi:hypothetical protein
MPAYLQEIEQLVLKKIDSDVKMYGMKITRIIGLNINLPEEVQKAIDKRGAMGALSVGGPHYQTTGTGESGRSRSIAKKRAEVPANCPKCADPIEPGSKFCNVCGFDLTTADSCRKCGAGIQAGQKICSKCGSNLEDLKREHDLRIAKNYEVALKYDDAIAIYDKYEMWEDAGRCRRLKQRMTSPQTKVDIGTIDRSTKISDSILTRSTVGGDSTQGFSVCPYCGKDLDFPKPPRFCPYCKEQLIR